MDYQDESGSGNWSMESSDAVFAAQLQRQFDDEDLLSAQMSQSFNNFLRPSLNTAHTSNPDTSSNLKNDEEIAKRLQRKFYLDMKKQGLSDVDIASMLDTLTPDSQPVDHELNMAVLASMGEQYIAPVQTQQSQSFLEKFLLTLHTNSCHALGAKVMPPPTDDFCVFREHAARSVKEMSDDMLLSVRRIVEMLLDTLNYSHEWNQVEATFFLINAVSSQINTSELNAANERLVDFMTNIQSTSNPLLINTTVALIGNLPYWLYINEEASVKCINWLLSLPPYEALLMSISRVLEKLASILHIEDSFKQILDFLPYVELTTDHGAEMEEAALGLIRCCTQLLNNKPSDQLVASLEALLNRPIYALNELSTGNHRPEDGASPNSWHVLATQPSLWINRIYNVFKTLHAWDSQKDYLNLRFGGEHPAAPWANLSQHVCQVLCQLISANANNVVFVENCCQCCIQIINSDLNGSRSLVAQIFNEFMGIYNQQPECYILKLSNQLIDEYTVAIDVEQIIANFLNTICIQTFESYSSIEELREHSKLIQCLFSSVNSFTRLRIAAFVEQPAAQLMFEMASFGLGIEENDLHKYSRSFISMLLQFPRNESSSHVLHNIELITGSCVERLIENCLRVALFETSFDLINTVAEVLSELLMYEKQKVDSYLGACLQRLIMPNNMDEIREFEAQLKRAISAEDMLKTFIAFSKNIH